MQLLTEISLSWRPLACTLIFLLKVSLSYHLSLIHLFFQNTLSKALRFLPQIPIKFWNVPSHKYICINIMSVSPFPCEEVTLTVKLLLLGESSVGKTSLVNRYTSHVFDNSNTLLTIGIEVRKIIKHLMGRKIRLELWDTSGQQRFRTIPANYFRGIQGIMLVYDITSGESFLRVEDWLQRIDQNCVRERMTLTLVGNKVDLQSAREVGVEEAKQFARLRGMRFSEASAKTAKGVDEMIQEMVVEIMGKGGLEIKHETIKLAVEGGEKDKEGCC